MGSWGRFYKWLFNHSCGLDMVRHKAFVFYCLIRILYSSSCFFIAIGDSRNLEIFLPSFIISLATNPLAIFFSRYNFKKTCLFHLGFSTITVTYYLFKFNTNIITHTVTPMIYMTIAILATLVVGRISGLVFFAISAISITLSLMPVSDSFLDRLPAPMLSTQEVMVMNGIYLTYTFFFISYAISLFLKYHNFYIHESGKAVEVNALLIDSNKSLSTLNYELEENIRALEGANRKLLEYAWVNNHEVRAPLATLMGLTYLLESNIDNAEERVRTIEYIKKTSSELDEIVKRLNTILNTPVVATLNTGEDE